MPKFLKKYFWDVDFPKIDYKKYPEYFIQRLLELGDIEAIRWLFKNFPRKKIESTLLTSSRLSEKSAIFWSNILDVSKERIRCLQPEFQKTRRTIWPY